MPIGRHTVSGPICTLGLHAGRPASRSADRRGMPAVPVPDPGANRPPVRRGNLSLFCARRVRFRIAQSREANRFGHRPVRPGRLAARMQAGKPALHLLPVDGGDRTPGEMRHDPVSQIVAVDACGLRASGCSGRYARSAARARPDSGREWVRNRRSHARHGTERPPIRTFGSLESVAARLLKVRSGGPRRRFAALDRVENHPAGGPDRHR